LNRWNIRALQKKLLH